MPEGQDGVGWKNCIFELRKVLSFFQVSCGARVKVLPPRKPLNHLLSSGVTNKSSAVEGKAPIEKSEKKSYAKALVGMRKSPEIAIERRGSVDFFKYWSTERRCGVRLVRRQGSIVFSLGSSKVKM